MLSMEEWASLKYLVSAGVRHSACNSETVHASADTVLAGGAAATYIETDSKSWIELNVL